MIEKRRTNVPRNSQQRYLYKRDGFINWNLCSFLLAKCCESFSNWSSDQTNATQLKWVLQLSKCKSKSEDQDHCVEHKPKNEKFQILFAFTKNCYLRQPKKRLKRLKYKFDWIKQVSERENKNKIFQNKKFYFWFLGFHFWRCKFYFHFDFVVLFFFKQKKFKGQGFRLFVYFALLSKQIFNYFWFQIRFQSLSQTFFLIGAQLFRIFAHNAAALSRRSNELSVVFAVLERGAIAFQDNVRLMRRHVVDAQFRQNFLVDQFVAQRFPAQKLFQLTNGFVLFCDNTKANWARNAAALQKHSLFTMFSYSNNKTLGCLLNSHCFW